MGRERSDERQEVIISFAESVILAVCRTFAKCIDAEATDYDEWVNGLNPLEEREEYLRDLTIGEVGIHCLITGIYDKCAQTYPGPSVEAALLIDLLKGIKEAGLDLALAQVEQLNFDEPQFWGLRRWKSKPVWVRRPPDMKEMLRGMNIIDLRPFK